jgi:hypothetical protein
MCEFEGCIIKKPIFNFKECDDYEPENRCKKPEDIKKRYKLLSDLLTDIKDNKIKLQSVLVSAFYMYYDGWNTIGDEEWKILTLFDDSVISHT